MSTSVGKKAEELAAVYLENDGHKIISMNWKTRWCEIDIVSTRKKVVYFTEVKYRSSDTWGAGLDYVMKQKVRQMHFAAEMWLHEHKWTGEAQLQVASVGSDELVELVEI